MYLDFYLLKKEPFHVTPDPEFLFLSPSHKAALRALAYWRRRTPRLRGPPGGGGARQNDDPTLLPRTGGSVPAQAIYLIHPNLSFRELLHTLCQECGGFEGTTENIAETITGLHHVLTGEYQQGRNVALLVDEAQHIPLETLEQLLLLSNLETSTQKLLQIVLVGQPEFEAKLNAQALRQLKQRLVIRATIVPLTAEESRDYIVYRLAKVRLADNPIFTRGALQAIITQAQGIPRVLNTLCTNALIQGFINGQPRISVKIAQEVIAEYTGKAPAGVAPMGGCGCGGGARAPGGMALGLPLRPQSLRQAPPAPGHAVWYAPGDPSGGTGQRATRIGQHPIPPSGARQRGRFPPPKPSAFPQMASVDVRIIQKGDQLAQVAREDTASPTLPSLRGSSKTIPTSRT